MRQGIEMEIKVTVIMKGKKEKSGCIGQSPFQACNSLFLCAKTCVGQNMLWELPPRQNVRALLILALCTKVELLKTRTNEKEDDCMILKKQVKCITKCIWKISW